MQINWCWGEWGFKFKLTKKWVKKMTHYDPKKVDKFYYDTEVQCCNPHDIKFSEGWGIIDFLKANWGFIQSFLKLLHWTTIFSRIIIFVVFFFGLNIIWINYFNWTKIL